MQTYLKTRPVVSQTFIFISLVAAALLIFVAMLGTWLATKVTGLTMFELSDVTKWNMRDGRFGTFLRLMLAVQFVGLFVVPTLVFAYLSDARPARYLGLRPAKPLFFVAGIVVMLAAIPLVEYLGFLNQKLPFPSGVENWMKSSEKEAQQQIGYLLKGSSVTQLLLNLVMIAGFAGIGEELLFRGVVQRLAIWGTKNVWVGIIIAAALFSALHLQFYGFFPRFVLGILLGAIYWYSGSLWPAMLAHFFYDALLIVLAYFNPAMIANEQASIIPSSYMAVLALVSLAVVVGLVIFMRKMSTSSEAAFHQERALDDPQSFTIDHPDGI